LSEFWLHQHQN